MHNYVDLRYFGLQFGMTLSLLIESTFFFVVCIIVNMSFWQDLICFAANHKNKRRGDRD